MSSVESTMDIDAFASWLDLRTVAAKDSLKDHLHQWTTETARLQELRNKAKRFKQAYREDPDFFNELQQRFEE